jgi:hypothetical protein
VLSVVMSSVKSEVRRLLKYLTAHKYFLLHVEQRLNKEIDLQSLLGVVPTEFLMSHF